MYRIIFEHWAIEDAVKEMKQGDMAIISFGKNIDHLFTPENVKWDSTTTFKSSTYLDYEMHFRLNPILER